MKNKVGVVGGAGHIGLPFSCYIQNKGIDTLIIDTNNDILELIKNKIRFKVPPQASIIFSPSLNYKSN